MARVSRDPSSPSRLLRDAKFSSSIGRVFFQFIFVASCFITGSASYDGTICCLKAARDPRLRDLFGESPRYVCSYNETAKYAAGTTFPSVNRSMEWCMENCPGIQYSDYTQWLQPLTTWVAPYIGLLLLCPTGDIARGWARAISWLLEYGNILGDPASAIFGAFSELYSDARTIWLLQLLRTPKQPPTGRGRFRRIRWAVQKYLLPSYRMDVRSTHLVWVSILANDTKFDDKNPRTKERMEKEGTSGADSYVAIKTIILGRTKFLKSVLLPVLLMLAVTAFVFYDAYTKLGDNDTAHSLAFGVWFSWLLVLSVAGNCFASGYSGDMVRTILEPFVKVSAQCVPLRKRYINSIRWRQWARQKMNQAGLDSDQDGSGAQYGHVRDAAKDDAPIPGNKSATVEARQSIPDIHVETEAPRPTSETCNQIPKLSGRTWLIFLVGQLTLGWFAVALPTAAAIAISWTTPTVGLGCRSFTFLLYGTIAAAVAVLNVLRQWADREDRKSVLAKVLNGTYWSLVLANALVMVIGMTFHLVGVFRSCRCKRLFAPGSDFVELNRNTQQAVDNARAFWLPVGFVVFGIQWFACGLVVAGRNYISLHMDCMVEDTE